MLGHSDRLGAAHVGELHGGLHVVSRLSFKGEHVSAHTPFNDARALTQARGETKADLIRLAGEQQLPMGFWDPLNLAEADFWNQVRVTPQSPTLRPTQTPQPQDEGRQGWGWARGGGQGQPGGSLTLSVRGRVGASMGAHHQKEADYRNQVLTRTLTRIPARTLSLILALSLTKPKPKPNPDPNPNP